MSQRAVYLLHGPQDGSVCLAEAADTPTGYPTIIRLTDGSGAYEPTDDVIEVVMPDGLIEDLPLYEWVSA